MAPNYQIRTRKDNKASERYEATVRVWDRSSGERRRNVTWGFFPTYAAAKAWAESFPYVPALIS